MRVRGLASSGRYAYNSYGPYGVGAYGGLGYGYANQADLSFRCDVDYRGYVRNVDINRRYKRSNRERQRERRHAPALFFVDDARSLEVQAGPGINRRPHSRVVHAAAAAAHGRSEWTMMGKFSRGASPLNEFRGLAGRSAGRRWRRRGLSLGLGAGARLGPSDWRRDRAFYRARGGAPLWFSPQSGPPRSSWSSCSPPRRPTISTRGATMCAAMSARCRMRASRRSRRGPARRNDAQPGLRRLRARPEARSRASASSMSIPSSGRRRRRRAALLNGRRRRRRRLSDYVQQMGWMNPIYAKLRQAIASRLYRSDAERRLLAAQSRARARAAVGQRALRHRQPAGGAPLHVRERPCGGFDARRRRAARTRSRRRR